MTNPVYQLTRSNPVDRQILEKILSGFGIDATAAYLDQLDLTSDKELLHRLSQTAFGDHELAKTIPELARRGIKLYTRWPPGNGHVESAVVFVVIGDATSRTFTTAVSSRLGRALDKHPGWFAALRTFCLHMGRETSLLISPGQFSYRFLRRLAHLLSIRVVIMQQTTVEQFDRCLREALSMRQQGFELEPTCVLRVVATADQLLKDDECVAGYCQEIRAIHIRPNGNIHQLVSARLKNASSDSPRRTMILTPSSSKLPKYIELLLGEGALAWHVFDPVALSLRERKASGINADASVMEGSHAKILRLDAIDPTKYVSHFTRRQRGAWVDESETNYLDSLLLGGTNRWRGALATLLRIVVQQQLIAGNRLTRDPARVVCFTNRPLREFSRLRAFRSHLARWDFEPYGLAIERNALRELGGRPVTYGNESHWDQTRPEDRPFFQIDGIESDWSIEDEWRVVGDVDLRRLGTDDVVAFVASESDAQDLAPFCHWPIVVLND